MEVYLIDSDRKTICFKHAVKAIVENNEYISIEGYDDSNCGQSGAWFIGGCERCEEERKEKE